MPPTTTFHVAPAPSSALIFGALKATTQSYPRLFLAASGLAAGGAAVLFAAHRIFRPVPATSR